MQLRTLVSSLRWLEQLHAYARAKQVIERDRKNRAVSKNPLIEEKNEDGA
jgi:hypothetical protein